MPAVRALAPAMRVSSESAASVRRSCSLRAPVDDQLGCALDQVDDAGGQLRARRRLASLAASREPPGQPRHERRGDHQRRQQDQAGRGEHRPHQRDRRRAHAEGDREGRHHAQQQILQRVHVVHEPREQIAAAEGWQAERSETLEARRRG